MTQHIGFLYVSSHSKLFMKHSEHRLTLFFGRGCLFAVNIVEIMGVTHAASGIVGKDRAMRCHDRKFKTKFIVNLTNEMVQQSSYINM